MLHRVKKSENREFLKWIFALQARLLKAACHQGVTDTTVTKDWIERQMEPLTRRVSWVRTFTGKPIQRELKLIANDPQKDKIWLAFVHDARIFTRIQDSTRQPYALLWPTVKLELTTETRDAIQRFFLRFYDPHFYAGHGYNIALKIAQELREPILFDHANFLKNTHHANPGLCVCPLCDGSIDGEEVDHFYPKSDYPFFSCHPWNLVTICSTCNGTRNKGPRAPLSIGEADPTRDWFHPYLNALADWTDFSNRPDEAAFQITFEHSKEGMQPKMLSMSSTITSQIANLDELVHLSYRWREELIRMIRKRTTQISYRSRKGKVANPNELMQCIQEWDNDKYASICTQPLAILEHFYLQSAHDASSGFFIELWVAATDADPVTAKPKG